MNIWPYLQNATHPVAGRKRRGEGVFADHVAGKAGGPGQTAGIWQLAGGRSVWQRRGVGHLQHVRHMAGGGSVQNSHRQIGRHDVQHGRLQITGVQRHRLAWFQIYLQVVFGGQPRQALFQRRQVVIRAGNVVAAAQVQPAHLRQILPEFLLQRRHGGDESVAVLLAERVHMQAVQQRQQARVEVAGAHAQTAAGSAGVVDSVGLGGKLRVHAEADAFAGGLYRRAELRQLAVGVENDVVGQLDYLRHILRAITGGEDMHLAAHFLPPKARFIKAAGRRARQMLFDERIDGGAAERLLRQQYLAAGAPGEAG